MIGEVGRRKIGRRDADQPERRAGHLLVEQRARHREQPRRELRRFGRQDRAGAQLEVGGSQLERDAARCETLIFQPLGDALAKADENARQKYIDVLEIMGANDPRTLNHRKNLTARLF